MIGLENSRYPLNLRNTKRDSLELNEKSIFFKNVLILSSLGLSCDSRTFSQTSSMEFSRGYQWYQSLVKN